MSAMPADAQDKKIKADGIILIGPAAPYRGGIAHFLGSVYRGLKSRGHSAAIINFSRQYPALLFPGKTQYENQTDTNPIPSHRLIDSINPLSWIKTVRYILKQRPQAVVFNHWMPFFGPAYGFIARRLKKHGIRVLCIVHNALPHERRPGDRALSQYFFKACDGFMVMSSAVAKDLKSLGVEVQVQEVRHPAYDHFGDLIPKLEARTRLGYADDQSVLLFFGFVRRYKGLQVLLDAMPAVVNALPDIQLIVAGECYEDEAAYRNFVTDNNLSENVTLRFEYTAANEVVNLFSAADVVVQPYLSATQSGVAQIAFHFERPLIVTDVGGLAEIVPHEKAGLVIPPDNPEALAAAIIQFFEHGLAERLRAGILEEKEKYSWDRFIEELEGLV